MTQNMETSDKIAIEPLLALDIQVRRVSNFAAGESIERSVFDVIGGRFEGSALRGRVLASGGDWIMRVAGVSQLDVRLVLETDDGVMIPLRYTGRASRRDGDSRIEIAACFDAPPGRYDWLNAVQAFGLGSPTAEGIHYQFYRFT